MSEHQILSKVRESLAAYILAQVPTATIYEAKRAGDKTAPCVECSATNAKEEPLGTGNFMVDASVSVFSIMATDADGTDPKTASDTLSSDVFAALEVDDLATQLGAAISNFTVQGFGEEKSFDEGPEGDCWRETWTRRIYCSGSDL